MEKKEEKEGGDPWNPWRWGEDVKVVGPQSPLEEKKKLWEEKKILV